MVYDSNNELNDRELDALSDEELFEYLDSKATYMKEHSVPLTDHLLKRYAHISAKIEGREMTQKEHRRLNKILKENQTKYLDDKYGN